MADTSKTRMVKLFYLGGLNHRRPDAKIATSAGNSMRLPQVGDFLEVPEYIADELMAKHKYIVKDENGRDAVYPVFTRNQQLAKRVVAGETVQQVHTITPPTVADYDDAELLAELERRGVNVEIKSEQKPEKASKSKGKPEEPLDELKV